jgi:hypothetical protein
MMRRVALTVFLMLAACGLAAGQAAQAEAGKCGEPSENCFGTACRRGEPVIFGKPYAAPRLRLRVVDEGTGRPLAGVRLTTLYVWQWLEYPYPEHLFGAWTDESYSASCATDGGGLVEVKEFNVVPHGWYKGIHSVGHKPRFSRVQVSMVLEKCIRSWSFDRKALDRCRRRGGTCELTLKASCPASFK